MILFAQNFGTFDFIRQISGAVMVLSFAISVFWPVECRWIDHFTVLCVRELIPVFTVVCFTQLKSLKVSKEFLMKFGPSIFPSFKTVLVGFAISSVVEILNTVCIVALWACAGNRSFLDDLFLAGCDVFVSNANFINYTSYKRFLELSLVLLWTFRWAWTLFIMVVLTGRSVVKTSSTFRRHVEFMRLLGLQMRK